MILGLGRSPGEGVGNLLQYSWASLVAQMVKNQPAMQETWVPSLGQEDPLEQEMATVATFLELLLRISLLSPDEKEQIEGR